MDNYLKLKKYHDLKNSKTENKKIVLEYKDHKIDIINFETVNIYSFNNKSKKIYYCKTVTDALQKIDNLVAIQKIYNL